MDRVVGGALRKDIIGLSMASTPLNHIDRREALVAKFLAVEMASLAKPNSEGSNE